MLAYLERSECTANSYIDFQIDPEKVRSRSILSQALSYVHPSEKRRFRDKAYIRMETEKDGVEYEEEDNECPICFDGECIRYKHSANTSLTVFLTAEFTIQPRVVTACKHEFCFGTYAGLPDVRSLLIRF